MADDKVKTAQQDVAEAAGALANAEEAEGEAAREVAEEKKRIADSME